MLSGLLVFITQVLKAIETGHLERVPVGSLLNDPTIIYSAVGTVQEMRELVELAAAGRVKTHVSRVGGLADVPSIFDDLAEGRYLGRAVLEIGTRSG